MNGEVSQRLNWGKLEQLIKVSDIICVKINGFELFEVLKFLAGGRQI